MSICRIVIVINADRIVAGTVYLYTFLNGDLKYCADSTKHACVGDNIEPRIPPRNASVRLYPCSKGFSIGNVKATNVNSNPVAMITVNGIKTTDNVVKFCRYLARISAKPDNFIELLNINDNTMNNMNVGLREYFRALKTASLPGLYIATSNAITKIIDIGRGIGVANDSNAKAMKGHICTKSLYLQPSLICTNLALVNDL